ncbi:membrane protein [Candidatus Mycoplasma haematolamae str. Purdue]|uniref:Membrane protein n=1 Tax=Mycoplasma haematolamae (strain Purdue) TaxID=1212765 RepID=I7BID6_MYCHA|nr:hypothetical protein [Candidatus Mycoplasma haematolamae]AFO51583.1 membrane protein [Candidatus Mycoplasma haematolamae str. Purdue]
MRLVSNVQFNYETNFNSFIKHEKNFKLCIQIFIIVSSIVVSILLSDKVQKLLNEYALRFFKTFSTGEYIKDFFQHSVALESEQITKDFQNPFTDYRRYFYGLIIFFTLEKIRICCRYFCSIKKWDKFTLSYGIYENERFLCVKRELLTALGSILAFGVSLVFFFVILGVAIFKELSKSSSFENNFMFESVIFALFFWLAFVVFFCLHIYERFHNYYRNYLKNNKIDQRRDAMKTISSLLWHYLLNIGGLIMVALNFPIDLFVGFLCLKFVPWRSVYRSIKLADLTPSERLFYSPKLLSYS